MRLTQITKCLATIALIALLMGMGIAPTHTPEARAQAEGRYYTQTGKTLAPEFVTFFDAQGGVPQLGYPLTDVEIEGGFKVQYLERARLEYHPENRGSQYEVQLGLLGSILTSGREFAVAPAALATMAPGRLYFPETRHTLTGLFLAYWQQYGGLPLYGYPISEPIQENGFTVQYFQRNRFELHPENAGSPYEVQLGLLGRDLLAQRVQVSESAVVLPTYGYEQGFYTPAGDDIAPYPRLDMAKVGAAVARTYRLVVLENHYLRLSIMPELGGRLYEAIYKPTGHNELYDNPVVKPSAFGERGWWLAAGGMEWAAPTQEHGLMEFLPWNASVQRNGDGGATVTTTAIDRKTGMRVTGAITLSPEEGAYSVTARMDNPTSQAQSGQLWTNAMLAPGGTNHISAHTRFIVPSNEMVVHSTSDPGLPGEHGVIKWPRYAGRDMSDMSTWKGWLGAFALPTQSRGSFAALYNPDADEGMVKSFKGSNLPGLKIFGFGHSFDPQVYTDDDSSYAELWGGVTPTFWDNTTIPPGGSAGWTEHWQPVAGTGGVSLASSWGTVSHADGVVRILPIKRIEGATLIVRMLNGETLRRPFDAAPDRPASISVPGSVTMLEITSPEGQSLLKGVPGEQ